MTIAYGVVFYLLSDFGLTLLIQNRIEKIFESKRNQMMERIMTNTASLSQPSGKLWLTVSQTIFHLNDLIAHKCVWIGKRCILALLAIAGCLWISPRLTLWYLMLLPLLCWLMQRISRRSQILQKQVLEQKSQMAEWIRQSCAALETIQAFQMESIMEEKLKQQNEAIRELAIRSDRHRIRLTLVKYMTSIGSLILVLIAGQGEPLEKLIAFSMLSIYIQNGLEMLDHIFYTYRLCKADIEALREVEKIL